MQSTPVQPRKSRKNKGLAKTSPRREYDRDRIDRPTFNNNIKSCNNINNINSNGYHINITTVNSSTYSPLSISSSPPHHHRDTSGLSSVSTVCSASDELVTTKTRSQSAGSIASPPIPLPNSNNNNNSNNNHVDKIDQADHPNQNNNCSNTSPNLQTRPRLLSDFTRDLPNRFVIKRVTNYTITNSNNNNNKSKLSTDQNPPSPAFPLTDDLDASYNIKLLSPRKRTSSLGNRARRMSLSEEHRPDTITVKVGRHSLGNSKDNQNALQTQSREPPTKHHKKSKVHRRSLGFLNGIGLVRDKIDGNNNSLMDSNKNSPRRVYEECSKILGIP